MPTFRVGPPRRRERKRNRLRNNECFRVAMEERLGVRVEMFPAPDYAGVSFRGSLPGSSIMPVSALLAMPQSICKIRKAVEPIFVSAEADGFARLHSPRCMSGPTVTFIPLSPEGIGKATSPRLCPTRNSTSGYLIPRPELRAAGINDAEFGPSLALASEAVNETGRHRRTRGAI